MLSENLGPSDVFALVHLPHKSPFGNMLANSPRVLVMCCCQFM